jgi:hypothetical protein
VDTGKDKQFVTLVFWAHHADKKVVLSPREHQDHVWIKPADVKKYKVVHYLEDCLTTFNELKMK